MGVARPTASASQRQTLTHVPPILAHEELLPAILRKYRPLEFETVLIHCEDDHDWLDIGLVLERGIDAGSLAGALTELAQYRMEAQTSEVDVRIGKSEKRGIPVSLKVRLGRTRKPSNDARVSF